MQLVACTFRLEMYIANCICVYYGVHAPQLVTHFRTDLYTKMVGCTIFANRGWHLCTLHCILYGTLCEYKCTIWACDLYGEYAVSKPIVYRIIGADINAHIWRTLGTHFICTVCIIIGPCAINMHIRTFRPQPIMDRFIYMCIAIVVQCAVCVSGVHRLYSIR